MTGDRERLAERTHARRLELLRTVNQVATRAGLAPRTVMKVEAAEPVREINLYKLDVGLDWEPGSARRVLEGGEPTPIDGGEVEPQPEPEDTDTRIDRLERRIAELEETLRQVRLAEQRKAPAESQWSIPIEDLDKRRAQ